MKKGFTLVELLVVIVIIGILAAAAISVFGGGTDKAKLNTMKSDVSAMHSAGTLSLADQGWVDGRLVGELADLGYLSDVPNNPFLGNTGDFFYAYAQSQVSVSANNATTTNPVIFVAGNNVANSSTGQYIKGGVDGMGYTYTSSGNYGTDNDFTAGTATASNATAWGSADDDAAGE